MWDLFERQQFEFNKGELKWPCKCPKCGKHFDQRSKLMLHITTKHNSLRSPNGKLFQCQQCQVKFIHKQSLVKHVDTHHSAGSSSEFYSFLFMCRECDEKFDCDYNLWCHMMLHALNKPVDCDLLKKYQCSKCPAKFIHKKDFKKHRKFFHKKIFQEAPRLFTCEVCAQQFEHKKDLKWHQAQQHTLERVVRSVEDSREKSEKPYQCRKCKTRFGRKEYLKWHMNLHRRPFRLSLGFLRRGKEFDLLQHRRWHLTLEKKDKSFTRDLTLVDNMVNRVRQVATNVRTALSSLLPKVSHKMPIHGINKPFRNTSPNWYAMV